MARRKAKDDPALEAKCRALVADHFAERVAAYDDALHVEELRQLEQRLRGKLPTLQLLVARYHVPLIPVVRLLTSSRLCWRFADPWQCFEGYSLKEVEGWAATLGEAAGVLGAVRNFPHGEWFGGADEGLGILGEDALRLPEDVMVERLAQATLQDLGDDPQDGWNRPAVGMLFDELAREWLENTPAGEDRLDEKRAFDWVGRRGDEILEARINKATELALEDVIRRGDALQLIRDTGVQSLHGFASKIMEAVTVLRIAERTLGRFRWRDTVNDTGRRFFGPGKRPQYGTVAACAHQLVNYLHRETNRSLYDHADALLGATFPETYGAAPAHCPAQPAARRADADRASWRARRNPDGGACLRAPERAAMGGGGAEAV